MVGEPCDAGLTSDAGVLPIRQLDEQRGGTARFAAALTDARQARKFTHAYAEMVRTRIDGVLAGDEGQYDHDSLRSDPVFKLIAGRRSTADDLARQPKPGIDVCRSVEDGIGRSNLAALSAGV